MRYTTRSHSYEELDDKLQRAQQEVHQLKVERNELMSKLQRVQTQFRRLSSDVKLSVAPMIPVVEAVSEDFQPMDPQHMDPQQLPLAVRKENAPHKVALGKSSGSGMKKATGMKNYSGALLRGQPAGRSHPKSQRLIGPVALEGYDSEREDATPPSAKQSGSKGQRLPSPAMYPYRYTPQKAVSQKPSELQAAVTHAREGMEKLKQENKALRIAMENTVEKASATEAKLSMEIKKLQEENGALLSQQKVLREEVQRLQVVQEQAWASGQKLDAQLQLAGRMNAQSTQQYEQAVRELRLECERLRNELSTRKMATPLVPSGLATAPHSNLETEELVESLKRRIQQLEEERRLAVALPPSSVLQDSTRQLGEHQGPDLKSSQSVLLQNRVQQLEADLALRTQEGKDMEKRLMDLVDTLQSCQREAETAVREESRAQIAQLQRDVEQAHDERRQKEKELLDARQSLKDAVRRAEILQADINMYKAHLEAQSSKDYRQGVEGASASMPGQPRPELNVGSRTEGDTIPRTGFSADEMQRIMAVAALLKRSREMCSDGTPLYKNGGDSLDLFESLGWDEKWEAKQLREALATAALDTELATQQCEELRAQAERYRLQLEKMTAERDELLEENIEWRHRITHVQTVFAKQQLHHYRQALEGAASRVDSPGEQLVPGAGKVSVCLRSVVFDEAVVSILHLPDRQGPTTLFFTLDGLRSFDTMISPTFYSLDGGLPEFMFQYDGLSPDTTTAAEIRSTPFVLQLHQGTEQGSRIIAQGELSGARVLQAREMSMEEPLTLVTGDGVAIGHVLVEFSCAGLLLPVLLGLPGSPGVSDVGLSAMEVKAAMVALRSVIALRIQVVKLEGICGAYDFYDGINTDVDAGKQSAALDATPPALHRSTAFSPYVFYTSSSPLPALSPVRDTAVYPLTGGVNTSQRIVEGSERDVVLFDAAPIEHRVTVDPEMIHFLWHSHVVFVVFDTQSSDIEQNLGTVEVPLRPLLESPQVVIQQTSVLHPRGKLTIGFSWRID